MPDFMMADPPPSHDCPKTLSFHFEDHKEDTRHLPLGALPWMWCTSCTYPSCLPLMWCISCTYLSWLIITQHAATHIHCMCGEWSSDVPQEIGVGCLFGCPKNWWCAVSIFELCQCAVRQKLKITALSICLDGKKIGSVSYYSVNKQWTNLMDFLLGISVS